MPAFRRVEEGEKLKRNRQLKNPREVEELSGGFRKVLFSGDAWDLVVRISIMCWWI